MCDVADVGIHSAELTNQPKSYQCSIIVEPLLHDDIHKEARAEGGQKSAGADAWWHLLGVWEAAALRQECWTISPPVQYGVENSEIAY